MSVRIRRARAAALLVGLAALAACGSGDDDGISVQVFAARYDERPGEPPPSGWQRVEFAGSQRTPPGLFLVSAQPVLTDWNIIAFRAAEEPDGSRAISLRLNAAGQKKIADFATDEASLKLPLAVQVDGRWADFSPLLSRPRDRMTLYGLTAGEAERLERHLAKR